MKTKKKTAFNLIDIFVVLIIFALIAGTAYFAWINNKDPGAKLREKNLTYTVRLSGVSEDFISVFAQDGLVYNSSTLNYMGTIKNVRLEKSVIPSDKAVESASASDTEIRYTIVQNKYDDVYDVYITLTAKALLDSRGIAYVDSERITVGSDINIRTQNFSYTAYITSFSIG